MSRVPRSLPGMARSFSVSAVLAVAAGLLPPSALPGRGAGILTSKPYTDSRNLVPASGALFGAYASPEAGGWKPENVTRFESQLGRRLDVDHRYYSWTTSFPTAVERWDIDNGRVPLITWEPWETTLDAIVRGMYDPMIRERARAMRSFGSPIFLRWAHEMNGDWYPWDGYHNNTPGTTDGPTKYTMAWRRIHDIFSSAGATNVVWVWCPNRMSFPTEPWNDFRNYYPGRAYVDWVCIDGYNRYVDDWKSFSEIFRPVYSAYAGKKPIMIAETASIEGVTAAAKARWIRNAQSAVKASFPAIKAFLWFHIRKDGYDWRANSSERSFAAFKTLARDAYFNP